MPLMLSVLKPSSDVVRHNLKVKLKNGPSTVQEHGVIDLPGTGKKCWPGLCFVKSLKCVDTVICNQE